MKREIFKKLYEDNFNSIVLFLDKYISDKALAEDLAQEAFIKLWNLNKEFTDEDHIKGFLYVSARNLMLNTIKHNEVEQKYIKQMNYNDIEFKNIVIEEESYRIIEKCIESLAPQSKRIIYQVIEGKNNKEISEFLKISVNTVRTLKYNAIKRLKTLLGNNYIIDFFLFSIHHFD